MEDKIVVKFLRSLGKHSAGEIAAMPSKWVDVVTGPRNVAKAPFVEVMRDSKGSPLRPAPRDKSKDHDKVQMSILASQRTIEDGRIASESASMQIEMSSLKAQLAEQAKMIADLRKKL